MDLNEKHEINIREPTLTYEKTRRRIKRNINHLFDLAIDKLSISSHKPSISTHKLSISTHKLSILQPDRMNYFELMKDYRR